MAASMVSTSASTGCIGPRRTPASPADAEAELDLVFAKREAGLACGGHDAGSKRDAHGTDVLRCRPGEAGQRSRGHRRASAAAPAILCTRMVPAMPRRRALRHGVAQGDVVGDDHNFHQHAFRAEDLRRETEVEPFTGVVLHDEQRAGRPGRGARGPASTVRPMLGEVERIPGDRRM